jgi:hypothetical protein
LANTSDLQGLWPPTSATGRTVVTTQLRGSALQGTGRYFIQVGTFTPDEAVRHLRSRLTDHPELADDVDGMANDLGLLPLALAQAAAFIIDEQVPCSEYRRRFADRRSRLDDLVPDPNGPVGLPDDYGRTVATTLSLSIERGQRSRPVGLARPLMELASVLDPAGIPATVFGAIAALNWLAYRRCLTHPDTGAGADATLVQSGLHALHRLNLVNIENGNVTVHGLVQRTTREFCSDEQLADVAWAAADAVAEVWPVIERDAPYAQQLRSSTTIVYQHGSDALLKPEPHPVLFRAADSLGNSGDPAGAAAAFEQMLTSLVQVFGADHPYTLATRGNLAAWRGRAGDLAGAATAFEQLLVDRLRVFGPDHPDTLTIRNNLAYCRGQAGNPAGAAAAFEQLAADLARVLGPDHPDTLTTRGNLSRWRGEAGNPAGAAGAFEQLLADFLRVLGPDHPDTLTTRNNLVFWRGQAGDLVGATHATEQLLADRLRVFGPDHPDTLTTGDSLAYWRSGVADSQ